MTEQHEHLEKQHSKLIEAVANLRHFQKEWKKYHASIDKQKMLVWERKVDDMLHSFNKQQKSRQGQMF